MKKTTLSSDWKKWALGMGLFLGLFIWWASPSLAQSGFVPPSVLPGENSNLGGYGNLCVGLANLIRTGDISLRHLPCFIKFFSQTLIALAGSVSVIFVMIGGYKYTILSTDGKEEAKKTIANALIGLAVSLMAWILVDIVLRFITE